MLIDRTGELIFILMIHDFPVDAQKVAATDYKPVPKRLGKLSDEDFEHFKKFFGVRVAALFGDLYYAGKLQDNCHTFTDVDGWTKFRQLQKRIQQ